MKLSPTQAVLLLASISLCLPACNKAEGQHHEEHHTIVVTSPEKEDVVTTQEYVCQIHSRRHIEVCALESGYLEEIPVREGQAVRQGDLMFEILPILYQSKLDSEIAEAQLAQIEYNNTKNLFQQNVVSEQELALAQAKLAKAQANVKLAQAEMNFTDIKAPFDGIMDRLHRQQGSLIEEGEVLTTLSDNSVMWVYFNVPEARYLEYMTSLNQASNTEVDDDDLDDLDDDEDDEEDIDDAHVAFLAGSAAESQKIELVLADGRTFPYSGEIGAIEATFNNETGNIPFRADFPNPDGLLRHGQTGTILIHRVLDDALVIPQRATFEILDKRYVFVVDDEGVVHQQEIVVQSEQDDVFVVQSGLDEDDKFVLDGVRQVHDGEVVECEFREPEEVLDNLKTHAE